MSKLQRKTQSTVAKNKETSTRGTGKGQKPSSGTRDQLIKDLQRVHKVFPQADPDRDFYRVHGKYGDAAWKAHFPRFKDFVAEAEVTPAAAVIRHLNQAAKLLQRDFNQQEAQKIQAAFDKVYSLLPSTMDAESEERVRAVLEMMATDETA